MLHPGALNFNEEGNLVDAAEARRIYEEWAEVIEYCSDLESEMIIWTQTEYDRIPGVVLETRRIFKEELHRYRETHRRQNG